jgi:hypothetical protein
MVSRADRGRNGREGIENRRVHGIPEHYKSMLDLQPSDALYPSPSLHYLLSLDQLLLA